MLSNRSLWVSFPWIRCETWHAGNVVVLGDAAHTAHWSIGSGTKLALEDAIALARAFVKHARPEAALAEFELERQPVVERLQDAGAGLVISQPHAVSPDGRVTPETPVDLPPPPAPEDSLLCVQLTHAGRRGACRPRRFGVDRPLPEAERWPLVSASPIAHAP